MARYPNKPGHVKGSETSKAAADKMDESAPSMRARIYRYIKANGPVTCGEVELALNMRHQSCSARIRELVLGKWIKPNGNQRKNPGSNAMAMLYVISAPPVDIVEPWLL